jgi:hypothetical protein
MAPFAVRPISALTRAFVARFFDNDFTRGSGDLRSSFFWLIAFLAPIGVFMPWMMMFPYQMWVVSGGTELLRHLAMADKVLYVGMGMAASAAIGVMTWSALLIDRRDALILGVMPVGGGTVVGAKLAALAIYIGIVAVGMHAAASVSFGFVLATGGSMTFMARGILAHLVASSLASLFVLFALTAVQAVLVLAAGPRMFARIAPLLQLVVTALVIGGCLALPSISAGIVAAIDGRSPEVAWVLRTPPAWFLGVYEVILGDADRSLRLLALAALTWTTAVVVVTVAVYPLVYRRVMGAAVLDAGAGHRRRARARLARLVSALVQTPSTRGIVEFTLAAFDRGDRHRFLLSMGAGIVLALIAPGALTLLRASSIPTSPSISVLSVPLVAILVMLVVVRIAGALPVQANAGWLFAAAGVPDERGRAALRHVMYAIAVLPPVAAGLTMIWPLWGGALAMTHAIVCLGAAALLAEGLLWRYSGVPATRAWQIEGAGLRKWWPLYLAGFALFTRGVPRVTLALSSSLSGLVGLAAVVAVLVTVIGRTGRPGAVEALSEDAVP